MREYVGAQFIYDNEGDLEALKPKSSPYIKSYTSFGGSDVVVHLNGKVFGEISGVFYEDTGRLAPEPVEGTMSVTKFDRPFPVELNDSPVDIRMVFMNEYGQARATLIEGVTFLTKKGGIHIDMIVEEDNFTFKARRVVEFESYIYKAEDKVAFIRENQDSTDRKVQAAVKMYKSELIEQMVEGRLVPVFNLDLGRYLKLEEEVGGLRAAAEQFNAIVQAAKPRGES